MPHTPAGTLPGTTRPPHAPPHDPPTAPETLRRSAMYWMARHLLDRTAGGVHRAAPAAGGDPLTGHKYLSDQADAVLALADGAPQDCAVALKGLHALLDRDGLPGFAEQADRSWQVQPAGRARTLRLQFQAATALLVGAHLATDAVARVRAVDLLNRCLDTCRDGTFPARLSEDWKQTVDHQPSPLTAAAAIRALAIADALGESDVDTEQLPPIVTALLRHARQQPDPGGHPQIALALAHAARLLDCAEHLAAAHTALEASVQHLASCDDTIGISAGDAADLLLAGAVLRSGGHDDRGATAVSRAAITRLADHRHGGFHTITTQVGRPSAVKYARVQSALAGALSAASALSPSCQDWPADDTLQ